MSSSSSICSNVMPPGSAETQPGVKVLSYASMSMLRYTLAPAGIGLLVAGMGYLIEMLEVRWSPVRAFPSFDDSEIDDSHF